MTDDGYFATKVPRTSAHRRNKHCSGSRNVVGSIVMKTMPIEVSGGVLRIPSGARLPPKSRLAVIVLEEDESAPELHQVADAGGAFDFLREEPELYSDADVLPD